MADIHERTLIESLNKMSIHFLEMLTSETEDGIIIPTQYIIEDGVIKGVL